jgi:hypothetical protein
MDKEREMRCQMAPSLLAEPETVGAVGVAAILTVMATILMILVVVGLTYRYLCTEVPAKAEAQATMPQW